MNTMHSLIDAVTFNADGLALAIVQEEGSGIVLMAAWMNTATLAETLETGRMVYYSRSRKARWLKGETSGHFQYVKAVKIDCDGDALLFTITQTGAACHENYRSCFFRTRQGDEWVVSEEKLAE